MVAHSEKPAVACTYGITAPASSSAQVTQDFYPSRVAQTCARLFHDWPPKVIVNAQYAFKLYSGYHAEWNTWRIPNRS